MALMTDEGRRILSVGEYRTLMLGLEPDWPSGRMGSWLELGSLPAEEVQVALAGARFAARTEDAHRLIDTALLRLGE